MNASLFEYWKDVRPDTFLHPQDEPFRNILQKRSKLCLTCLPVPCYGPLKTAKIVFLYLNPGLSDFDMKAADDPAEREFFWRQRQGDALLREQKEDRPKSWWVSRTKYLGLDIEYLRRNLAILELCPYHSKSFSDWWLLTELPSCKVALNWAKNVLIPEARRGERIVICLRSAKYWGLQAGQKYDGQLFSPKTTRQGFPLISERPEIIAAVKRLTSISDC